MSTGLTATEVTKAMDSFDPPTVEPGMTILWYAEGKRVIDPLPAVVISLTRNTKYIEIWVYDQHKRKRRVRHLEDPELLRQSAVTRADGAWDHTPFNKALLALVESPTAKRAVPPPPGKS